MSVCDTCPKPGSCCRFLILGGGSFARDCQTTDEAEAFIRASGVGPVEHEGRTVQFVGPPMPFHPLFKRQDGAWQWWCPNLNRQTGRCDDYANRPVCCSHYEPGTDGLCVLHVPEPVA